MIARAACYVSRQVHVDRKIANMARPYLPRFLVVDDLDTTRSLAVSIDLADIPASQVMFVLCSS